MSTRIYGRAKVEQVSCKKNGRCELETRMAQRDRSNGMLIWMYVVGKLRPGVNNIFAGQQKPLKILTSCFSVNWASEVLTNGALCWANVAVLE